MRPLPLAALLLGAVLAPALADAKPVAPAAFCSAYPTAPACLGGVPPCTLCHLGSPPNRNLYGMAIEAALLPGAPRPLSDADFLGALANALTTVEAGDADGDTFTNGDEIIGGTLPYDDRNFPDWMSCGGAVGINEQFDVCNYDPRYTLKKVYLDFCGRSPTEDEMNAFEGVGMPRTEIHAALDRCLDSQFWVGKDGQLWKLAHKKIRPLRAIKQGEDGGQIPLADYYDDYALYVWSQIDNHDARALLTADFYVVRRAGNPTRYDVAGANDPIGIQDVAPQYRAGMLTTRYNLVLNVMFTALPRTAAAQAYRSFLGLDIAKQEGLGWPIDGEPLDYDDKGVQADACRLCHATLDPLSYPFKNYQGLTGNFGTYDPDRIQNDFNDVAPNINAMPEAGAIFGRPVANLKEWGQVAANSEQFAKASVQEYWRLLFTRDPVASEQETFTQLWRDFMGRHAYGVENMLHALIDTEAYGAP